MCTYYVVYEPNFPPCLPWSWMILQNISDLHKGSALQLKEALYVMPLQKAIVFYNECAGLRRWNVQSNYFDPWAHLSETAHALLAYTTTPLPIDFFPSEMPSKVRDSFEVLSCLHSFSASIISCLLSMFSFLLVSSPRLSSHSVNHASPYWRSLPVLKRLLGSWRKWGEKEGLMRQGCRRV